MPKTLKPGSEVDAWCTKCRMDLLHRIIAMEGPKIARVECRTCNGHHNYRQPKSSPAAAATKSTDRAAKSASGKRSPSLSPRKQAAQDAERHREMTWEKAVAGKPVTSFRAYRASQTFNSGELIRHGKFGDGYIVRVIDRQKVEVMFKDGPRTLAQSLEG
jgi:hypothetical protein